MTGRGVRIGLTGLFVLTLVPPAVAQDSSVGRARIEGLVFPPLEFDAPEPTLHEVSDVRVLHLEDPTLPIVDVILRIRGGYARFPRDSYAAASALPFLVRNGGTRRLAPDSIDALIELYALQMAFGGGGESIFSTLSVLRDQLPVGLELWGELIREPGFDADQVEVWRGRELDSARRRRDDPGILAYSTFNRIMYGDHPVGWEMGPEDLEPSDVTPEALERLHRRLFCRENMVLGVTGDVGWDAFEPLLEEILAEWPSCDEPLPPPRLPEIRTGPAVFLIPHDLNQSTVVMAHASDIGQDDGDPYFASRIGNAILGASGFGSRLMARIRTEEGYAYSASSLWTAPRRGQGLMGVVTQTRSETTIAAIRALLEVVGEMGRVAPTSDEILRNVQDYANGFVFNFQSPDQIVSRRTLYLLSDLPDDWLDRYLEGIQKVSESDVLDVFREHVHPEEMVILVLGDPEGFEEPLDVFGPVTVLER